MAQFCTGDMWTAYETAGLFLITTNSTVKADGCLVMGRGIAGRPGTVFPAWTQHSARKS